MTGEAGHPSGAGIPGLLLCSAAHFADDIALCATGVQLTYRDLHERSVRLSESLRAGGLRAGDRVAILLDNCSEWFVSFFAVIEAGGIAVPLSYYTTVGELALLQSDAEFAWLITSDHYAAALEVDRFPSLQRVIVDDDGAIEIAAPASLDGPLVTPRRVASDVILMQYTSGTSGSPKAALHTHETVAANSLNQISDLELDSDSVTLVATSLAWGAGVHDLTLATMWVGGRVVLHPSRRLAADALAAAIAKERVTHVFLAPSVLRRLVREEVPPAVDLSSLRVLLTGGEALSPKLVDQLVARYGRLPLRPSYGLSEFPSTMLLMPRDGVWTRPESVGRPTRGSEVTIVDDGGQPVGPDEIGELLVRSPATMRGYHNDPAQTARALRAGWLYTGDLARRDDAGFYYICGRKKDMLISGGLNVSCAEVEAALLECPGVREAAVVAVADLVWGEVPQAHIVLEAGGSTGTEAVEHFLADRLAPYKRPKTYVVHSAPLPRGESGKVRKQELRPQ